MKNRKNKPAPEQDVELGISSQAEGFNIGGVTIPVYSTDQILRYYFQADGSPRKFFITRYGEWFADVVLNRLMRDESMVDIVRKLILGTASIKDFEKFESFLVEDFAGMPFVPIEPFYFAYCAANNDHRSAQLIIPQYYSEYWASMGVMRLPQTNEQITRASNFLPNKQLNTLLWHIWLMSRSAFSENESINHTIEELLSQIGRLDPSDESKVADRRDGVIRVMFVSLIVIAATDWGLSFCLFFVANMLSFRYSNRAAAVHDYDAWTKRLLQKAIDQVMPKMRLEFEELVGQLSLLEFSEQTLECVVKECCDINTLLSFHTEGKCLSRLTDDDPLLPNDKVSNELFNKVIVDAYDFFAEHSGRKLPESFLHLPKEMADFFPLAVAYGEQEIFNELSRSLSVYHEMIRRQVESMEKELRRRDPLGYVRAAEALYQEADRYEGDVFRRMRDRLIQKGLYQEYPPIVLNHQKILSRMDSVKLAEHKLKQYWQRAFNEWQNALTVEYVAKRRVDFIDGFSKGPVMSFETLILRQRQQEKLWQMASDHSFNENCVGSSGECYENALLTLESNYSLLSSDFRFSLTRGYSFAVSHHGVNVSDPMVGNLFLCLGERGPYMQNYTFAFFVLCLAAYISAAMTIALSCFNLPSKGRNAIEFLGCMAVLLVIEVGLGSFDSVSSEEERVYQSFLSDQLEQSNDGLSQDDGYSLYDFYVKVHPLTFAIFAVLKMIAVAAVIKNKDFFSSMDLKNSIVTKGTERGYTHFFAQPDEGKLFLSNRELEAGAGMDGGQVSLRV